MATLGLPLFAQTADPAPFPQPRITVQEWQSHFSQVKALPGAEVFEQSAPDQVIVQLLKQSTVFIFTTSTHPAHPAVVRRQIAIDAKGDVRFARTGYFAGDQTAYEAWQTQFDELDRHSAELIRQRLRSGKQ